MRQAALRRRMPGWCRWVAVITVALAGTSTAPRATAPARPSAAESVDLPSTGTLHQYRALRRMHALSEKFNHEGWMEARTERDERGFRYEIVSERGSDYVRNKVLKAVLKREQEIISGGDPSRTAPIWYLGGRGPRRQPGRHGRHDPRGTRTPARSWADSHDRGSRGAERGTVDVESAHRTRVGSREVAVG